LKGFFTFLTVFIGVLTIFSLFFSLLPAKIDNEAFTRFGAILILVISFVITALILDKSEEDTDIYLSKKGFDLLVNRYRESISSLPPKLQDIFKKKESEFLSDRNDCFYYGNKKVYISESTDDKKRVKEEKFIVNNIANCIENKILKEIKNIIKEIDEQIIREDDKLKKGKMLAKSEIKDGLDFEKFVANALKENYYKVEVTPHSGDYGADVIAEKNGKRICIQCKYWKQKVGVKAIQEIFFAKDYYKCDEAWIVTSQGLTEKATNIAKDKNIMVFTFDEFYERFVVITEENLLEIKNKINNLIKERNEYIELLKEHGIEVDNKYCPRCDRPLFIVQDKYNKYKKFLVCFNCKYEKRI